MKAKRGSETTAMAFAVAFSVGVGAWFVNGGSEVMKNKLGGGLKGINSIGEGAVIGDATLKGTDGQPMTYTYNKALGEVETGQFQDQTVVQSSNTQEAYNAKEKKLTIRSGSTSFQTGIEGVKKVQ